MNIQIRVVDDLRSLRQFVEFPFQLYKNNPFWIPPLKAAETAWLSPSKNPAFKHASVKKFTAWKGNKMVGRIAGIINDLETEHLAEKHARFGWFDFVDDPEVSKALVQAVEDWAKSQGAVKLKGPYGFNSLDKNGMLVEGFCEMGAMTTLYNFDYYPKHILALGYEKELEWLEMQAVLPKAMPEKITAFSSKILERFHLKVKQPKNKVELIFLGELLFNMLQETYQHLPGFVPISPEQQTFYIKNYIGLLPVKFVCVVEHETEGPVGFGLTMPNMSKAMRKANGSIWPFGFAHLLKAQYFNDTGDLTLIGVKEEWRKKGVHGIIFNEIGNIFIKMGITHFNINPMLEHNQNVLQLWKEFEHRIHKRRRTYAKDLA
jgi:hypothetical protein